MEEKFQIPAVSGIIERSNNGKKEILIQVRQKSEPFKENGLFEIPAGKIREFESIYDALRREILEETGLKVTKIHNELTTEVTTRDDYRVIGCEPFFVSQNISGNYPVLCITLLCEASGQILSQSDESVQIQWVGLDKLEKILRSGSHSVYPMHIDALNKYLIVNTKK